jgi:hypothetical protein
MVRVSIEEGIKKRVGVTSFCNTATQKMAPSLLLIASEHVTEVVICLEIKVGKKTAHLADHRRLQHRFPFVEIG